MLLYSIRMISSFRHDRIRGFFETGSKAGINPAHAKKLNVQLGVLNQAKRPEDMNLPGWTWHPLTGALVGRYAISVNGNWRLTYEFVGGDAVLVDYEDSH